MASYSSVLLSGGHANGGWLTLTDTATLGEIIHTAHATAIDQIYLWANNVGITTVDVTLEWGSASDPAVFTITPKESWFPLSKGMPMTGSDVLSAFCPTASVVIVHGYVDRIT